MSNLKWIPVFFSVIFSGAAWADPVQTVSHVDLNRYMGKWYEIAAFPQRFQRGCFASTAEYTLNQDQTVKVVNECKKGSVHGPWKRATGVAWVVNHETNAELKVRFFWPFKGDYWVIDLGANYEYAVVGDPSRRYLWILSRTPQMDETVYQGILERVAAQHFDITRLNRTEQLPVL